MGHSVLTGVELGGHYIEVDGAESERELLDVLQRLVSPESVERPSHCPPLMILEDGRTIMYVDIGPEPGEPATLAIGNLDDDGEARERVAEVICRALASLTEWRLHCSVDGGEGAPGMRWAC